MTVAAGDVIGGKYRVERLLGRGGMGYVVAARHLTLDQTVAIKLLRRNAVRDESALARFRQEAKACVLLRSEHVATVIDVGMYGEEPYIVMEHLVGNDLGDEVDGGRTLPIRIACDYVIQACKALAEAHANGIIHRDIKLPNLFLTKSATGEALLKVLDFGVSKIIAGENKVDFTQTTACLGSPKYMSPEQMNDARAVDPRTDIWSLGVCLYRMVAGRGPFEGDTIGRVCTLVLHEMPPSISALRAEVPAALEAVIACCLQKDRAHRFSNVAELAASLASFASEPDRAVRATEHIATVLGVRTPPPGYLPPPPPMSLVTPTSGTGFDAVAAWAHTTRGRPAYSRPSPYRLAYGFAAVIVLTLAAKCFLPSPGMVALGGKTAAAAPPARTLVTTPVPLAPPTVLRVADPSASAPRPSVIAASSAPAPAVAADSTPPVPATNAGASGHRRTRGRWAKPPKLRDDDAPGGSDQGTIPSDRK